MKRPIEIMVHTTDGRRFGFVFKGDDRYLTEWREAGLEVEIVLNTIPVWAQRLGLTRPWCAVQDLWAWMRLW